MTDIILTGTQPKADARLLADIDAADPFDGGCPADIEPRTSVQAAILRNERELEERRVQQKREWDNALKELVAAARANGVRDAIVWLRNVGASNTADCLEDAHAHGEVLK